MDEAQPDIAAQVEPEQAALFSAEAEHRVSRLRLLAHAQHLARREAAVHRRLRPVADRDVARLDRRVGGRTAQRRHQLDEIAQRRAVQIDQRAVRVDAVLVEAAAEVGRLPDARAVALERRMAGVAAAIAGIGRISARRRVVRVEARAVAVPARGDRRPVEGRVAHRLVALGVTHADLERVEPAALIEVELPVLAQRELVRVIVLDMPLDERDPVIVRVGEPAGGVVYVGAGQQLDLRRAVLVHRILVIGHRAGRDQDVVVVGRGLDVLDVQVEVDVGVRIPADVARQVLGSFAMREVARLVLEI